MQWPNGVVAEEDDWEFYPEAIKSWRSWLVVERPLSENVNGIDQIVRPEESVIMLRSITYQTLWTPRQEMIAQCVPLPTAGTAARPKPHTHACPDISHGCGIYSVKTKEQALAWKSYRQYDAVVWGQVNIWGHVYKFTKGYLSEFAYPANLVVPNDLGVWAGRITPEMLALELQQTYGVEAVTE